MNDKCQGGRDCKSLRTTELDALDQSGNLLCRNNDCDVIKGIHSNPLARKKGSFFFSISYRISSKKLESPEQSGFVLCHKRL